MPSRDVQTELYSMGGHTTAHLYAVPVPAAFDAVRNCSHCLSETVDDCATWRKLRKAVAALKQEAKRYVKGVDELRDATGGRPANIHQFGCGSVAYFAPGAPDFREAGELKGDAPGKALRVLDAGGAPGGKGEPAVIQSVTCCLP